MKPDLLRAQRIQQGWSQAKLANKLGVDIRTVRRWELGEAAPVPYYRKRLLRLFDKTAKELGLCSDSDENESVEGAPTSITQLLEPDVPDDVEESPSEMQTNPSYWQHAYEIPLLMDNIVRHGLPILGAKYNKSRLLRLMLFLSVITVLISLAFFPPEIFIHSIRKVPAVTNTKPASQSNNQQVWYTQNYEAESSVNTLSGGAVVRSCSACSGGQEVGELIHGGSVQFNDVNGRSSGTYTLTLYYIDGSPGDRVANISVNGDQVNTVHTYGTNDNKWTLVQIISVQVNLNAGNNTILFSTDSSSYSPDIDRITIS